MTKKNVNGYFFGALLLSFSEIALSCACFNSNFLISIFSDSKPKCDVHLNNKIIVAIRINGGKNQALTDSTGCVLNADYHFITRSYEPMSHTKENNQCIIEILTTCRSLNSTIYYN